MVGEAADMPTLIAALTRVSTQIQRVCDRSAAEAGISPTQARLLRALGDGAPTVNELARQLGLDKSSTSGLIDRAQLRGLVRRVPSQRDRRSVRVRLTAAGRDLAAEIDSLASEALATMLEPLAAGERAALSALARLAIG